MYAEDRRLLPVDYAPYAAVSLRKLRLELLERERSDAPFIPGVVTYWPRLRTLFDLVDAGEPAAGLPPYNGGLFNRQTPELLARAELPDNSICSVINNLGAAAVSANGSAGAKVPVNFPGPVGNALGDALRITAGAASAAPRRAGQRAVAAPRPQGHRQLLHPAGTGASHRGAGPGPVGQRAYGRLSTAGRSRWRRIPVLTRRGGRPWKAPTRRKPACASKSWTRLWAAAIFWWRPWIT